MKKILSQRLLLLILLLQINGAALAADKEIVDVYRNPGCSCCLKWVELMRTAGFDVRVHDNGDAVARRANFSIPEQYGSCHTAKVGSYSIEGHVPVADIQRLLKEKPRAVGLAVPGMPLGSPGMEHPNPVAYNTMLIQHNGSATVFTKH